MKLKADRISIDVGGKKTPLGPIRHYNPHTGEPLTANEIEIEAVQWNRSNESLIVFFTLGGTDSSERFIPAPGYATQHYTFSKLYTENLWEEFELGKGKIDGDRLKILLFAERPAIHSVAAPAWNVMLDTKLVDDGVVITDYKEALNKVR